MSSRISTLGILIGELNELSYFILANKSWIAIMIFEHSGYLWETNMQQILLDRIKIFSSIFNTVNLILVARVKILPDFTVLFHEGFDQLTISILFFVQVN